MMKCHEKLVNFKNRSFCFTIDLPKWSNSTSVAFEKDG